MIRDSGWGDHLLRCASGRLARNARATLSWVLRCHCGDSRYSCIASCGATADIAGAPAAAADVAAETAGAAKTSVRLPGLPLLVRANSGTNIAPILTSP